MLLPFSQTSRENHFPVQSCLVSKEHCTNYPIVILIHANNKWDRIAQMISCDNVNCGMSYIESD